MKNLVIVESPAKAKTIEKFLGKDYLVTSSYGHVRDLEKKNYGVDIENNFKPNYKISDDKKAVVKELKKLAKKAETIWLATDEDREGEAISWHLKEALELENEKIKRIVFHEITKNAILTAIENARNIDDNLVDAQQARRILDRLVGFELSPLLWKKVRPQLSAGRVQSVAVRLIVEREREIEAFTPESQFRVTAEFYSTDGEKKLFKSELDKKFKTQKEAEEFLAVCRDANYSIESLQKKPFSKSPSPPFTTSTLQQEASRKLGFSVVRTMIVAQKLYEAGHITYMRTDSVNLSDFAIEAAESQIVSEYGKNYAHSRRFKTKSASAQEAHEAIRPTYFNKESAGSAKDEKSLYDLIWKRAIASQMSNAELERTTLKIALNNHDAKFVSKGEIIKFDGFLKVYLESKDDENGDNEDSGLLPPLKEGENLAYDSITATERYTRAPARYTEASLVKKLEELGIGRPSTYAPTISTVQKRGYVLKDELPGFERSYAVVRLSNENKIESKIETEITGAIKGRLYPADIAKLVNDFLLENFPKILDFKFTAHVEKELDDIANGQLNWSEMLKEFYFPFHETVEHTTENSERVSGERILGNDPKSGKQISVRMARFGPVAQLTDLDDEEAKPDYAGLRPGQTLELITLEEALDLFKLPRTLGKYEEKDVVVAIGRFGPYIRHDGKFVSLKKEFDPYTVDLETAIEQVELKRKKDEEAHIKTFEENPEFKILNGRWGPYLKAGKQNIRIPKDKNPAEITFEEAVALSENPPPKGGKKGKKGKKK
ncbi:MAG: type I DNA topoisomerase [Melioribacteraceae bacterium]|nr:type I DNA topoisomerase [Melioribacteraceae bacterium]MCF8264067.1 type I DNA topoisomerase [Melioribacteraceae bacterium]MCF8413130.1 type I DNA topoisomerase [Melioribacteraceae bacterium]MCF8430836.1 type I DNA topoisomerase [Melioribacteraceae bacterium]